MSRGQQGIGISAAGMYGLLTTGKSVHITSRTSPEHGPHMQIQMDTAKNRADVIVDEETEVDVGARAPRSSSSWSRRYAKGRRLGR